MRVLHKQSCPSCGQSVNPRKIKIFLELLLALREVWIWAYKNNVSNFTRKDIKQITQRNENVSANFGYLTWAGGLIYRPEPKRLGHYGINKRRCWEFFSGQLQIPTLLIKNPLTQDVEKTEYKFFKDIKGVKEHLNEHHDFIVEYEHESGQTSLADKLFSTENRINLCA